MFSGKIKYPHNTGPHAPEYSEISFLLFVKGVLHNLVEAKNLLKFLYKKVAAD
jgi:hypothetical protein